MQEFKEPEVEHVRWIRSIAPVEKEHCQNDYCSSGELGLAGLAINEEEPCEAQARGFTHGHRKVYGIPEPFGPEMLRQFQAISAGKPDTETGATDDLLDKYT